MTTELPKYVCHKEVWALKVSRVVKHSHPDPKVDEATFEASSVFHGAYLVPERKDFLPIPVDAAWYRKHKPSGEGYYVVYADGSMSWSPAEAFEQGYVLADEPQTGE